MEIIKAGHVYDLADADGGPSQTLSFVEGPKESRVAVGTTTEEVIKTLIDRVASFQKGETYSDHNQDAINGLETALAALEARTADRVERGVEGTNAA